MMPGRFPPFGRIFDTLSRSAYCLCVPTMFVLHEKGRCVRPRLLRQIGECNCQGSQMIGYELHYQINCSARIVPSETGVPDYPGMLRAPSFYIKVIYQLRSSRSPAFTIEQGRFVRPSLPRRRRTILRRATLAAFRLLALNLSTTSDCLHSRAIRSQYS